MSEQHWPPPESQFAAPGTAVLGEAVFGIPGPAEPPLPQLPSALPPLRVDLAALVAATDRLTWELAALRADLAARSLEGRLRRLAAWLRQLWSRLRH